MSTSTSERASNGLGDLFGMFQEGPKLESATLFNLTPISKQQSMYLQKVYTLMSGGILLAAASAYYSPFTSPFFSIISLVLMVAIQMTAHRQYEGWYVYGRPAMFFGVCSILGASLRPLLELADFIDPSMVKTSALASIAGFTSLSVAAVLNFKSRTFLLMASTIGSLTLFLASVSFMNYFMRSKMIIDLMSLAQFGMTLLYTLFDTQVALASVEHNRTDYVSHALQFFINLFRMFVFVLEQLIKKSDSSEEENPRRRSKKNR